MRAGMDIVYVYAAHAVLQRAAVGVAALVAAALQEVHGQREVVRGVDVDDVHAGAHGAHGGLAVPASVIGDVLQRHRACLRGVAVLARLVRGADQHLARIQVRRGGAVVRQLHRGQRAVRVHLVAHQREGGDVAVVPQPRLHVGREVAAGVDLAFLGGHHRPAALRLHFAHGRVGQRHGVAHAVAVGHLEEAVLRGDRADLYRGEQDVVAGVAHGGLGLVVILARARGDFSTAAGLIFR